MKWDLVGFNLLTNTGVNLWNALKNWSLLRQATVHFFSMFTHTVIICVNSWEVPLYSNNVAWFLWTCPGFFYFEATPHSLTEEDVLWALCTHHNWAFAYFLPCPGILPFHHPQKDTSEGVGVGFYPITVSLPLGLDSEMLFPLSTFRTTCPDKYRGRIFFSCTSQMRQWMRVLNMCMCTQKERHRCVCSWKNVVMVHFGIYYSTFMLQLRKWM